MADLDSLESPLHDMHDTQGVAERLRLARTYVGLSQQEFADQIGYSRRQVNAWENGSNTPPIWALLAVRKIFDIDPEWVLAGPGDIPLRDTIPADAHREQRLITEVASMARDVGLTLPKRSIENLAQLVFRETPEAEPAAKKQLLKTLKAISLGQEPV
jgi:transcriptional regulator with XRE-family HTH domain